MMPPLSLTPLKPQTQLFSLIPNSPFSTLTPLSHFSIQTLTFPRIPISPPFAISLNSSSYSSQPSSSPSDDYEEEHVVGDCLVFEEGIFEDPYLQYQPDSDPEPPMEITKPIRRKPKISIEAENLVPDKWKEVQAELNITKKERRKLAQELEFQSRIKMKKKVVPLLDTEEYLTFREAKMTELKQVVLDNPSFDSEGKVSEDDGEKSDGELGCSSSGRVAPRNPRVAVYKGSLDDITEFFNSGYYELGEENAGKNSKGRRKLFTKEEKSLMNKRTPNLAEATCKKWLPLHSLAASGDFYLVDALLKYNVDINAIDKDGLTALHKAILCKKMAVMNYLLRESANPFVCDKEGATLMHYAVQTASSPTIKILLLYNVDINLADDDGWTPLHLAVQTRRTDIVKLLLIKGADKSLKNRDGLTPLDLCLYSGRHVRTYELIKLLKQLPKSQQRLTGYQLI